MRSDCLRLYSPVCAACLILATLPPMACGQGADIVAIWGGSVGGWSDASRWSSAFAPDNGNGGLTYDAIVRSGTVSLSSSITIESLRLAHARIDDVSGQTLTVLNDFNWSSGSLLGSGALNANDVTLHGSNKFLDRSLSIAGVADWSAGSLAFQLSPGDVELLPGSRMNVAGTNNRTMPVDFEIHPGATLNHNTTGTTTHGGFGTAFVNSGVVNISDGVFSLTGASSGAGDFVIASPATFQVRGGTTDYTGGFSGSGTVQVSSAVLNLNAGSTFNVANLVTTGGQVAFNTGASVTIPSVTNAATIDGGDDLSIGDMTWTSGNLRGSGVKTVDEVLLDGSNKFLDARLRVANRATWNRGSISFASSQGTLDLLPGSLLEIAGTVNRTLSVGLSVQPGATIQQSSGATVTVGLLNSPFENNGRVSIDNGEFAIAGNANGSGLLSVDSGSTVRITNGTHSFSGQFEGEGTVEFRGGTTSFESGATYQIMNTEIRSNVEFNTGSPVEVQNVIQAAGNLRGVDDLRIGFFEWLGGVQTGSGTTIVEGGKFSAQQKLLDRTVRIVGNTDWDAGNIAFNSSLGTLQVESGQFVVTGDRDRTIVTRLEIQTDGTFHHESTGVTTSGQLGSTLTNNGTLRVENGRFSSFDGFTNYDATTRTLTGGTYDLASEFRFRDADVVTNQAEIILRPGWSITDRNAADGMTNFSANGANGIFRMRDDVQFAASGSINNRGLFAIEDGQLFVDDLQNEVTGTVSGGGVIFGGLNNEGLVQPGLGVGRLELQGAYLQTETGTLSVEYGGLTAVDEHDVLQVFESATLAGDLRVVPVNGQSDPTAQGQWDEIQILTSDSVNGFFETVWYDGIKLNPPSVDADGSFAFYVGQNDQGTDGLFRGVRYEDDSVTFFNYLALPADANGDGVVDVSDFGVWNANKFTAAANGWASGDFNNDGFVDVSDFNIWNTNKFTGGVFDAVPEPTSGVLAWLALVVLCQMRRTIRTRNRCS